MASFTLLLKIYFYRVLQAIYTLLDIQFSYPPPRRVSFRREIKSTVSSVPGSFDLLFWIPKDEDSSTPPKRRPLLINFHGGGFTLGHAGDDARWATAVISKTPAVVVSVDYRLAPEFPFPIGIEDCVSAILWLWQHAEQYNLDISRTALSGFSAGGNFTYAVSIRLHEELEKLRKKDLLEEINVGKIVSLVVFYGSTDRTLSRAEKAASNPNLIPAVPTGLWKLFEEAYLPVGTEMAQPLISPGIAHDDLLRVELPDNLVLINCGGDHLLAESERFRERLKGLGKNVDGCVVEGVPHGWDKIPTYKNGDVKRDEAYELAIKSLEKAWE